MPNYIIAYHGGKKPESPEDGAKHIAKFQTWVVGLGSAAVNPATPLRKTKIVRSTGVSDDGYSNPMSGFSIIKADNIDAAVKIAKKCPHLDIGGTLEVAEIMGM